jgi:hypothetical protein
MEDPHFAHMEAADAIVIAETSVMAKTSGTDMVPSFKAHSKLQSANLLKRAGAWVFKA